MADTQAFGYARVIAPPLWALIAIATLELVVAHLLLRLWSPTAALILSGLTALAIGWIAAGTAMLRRRPVLLTDDKLVWRLGTLKRLDVPRALIAGLAEAPGQPTFNCAGVSAPNIHVALREPVQVRGRAVTALAHHLDDPQHFGAALAAWIQGCPTTAEDASRPKR